MERKKIIFKKSLNHLLKRFLPNTKGIFPIFFSFHRDQGFWISVERKFFFQKVTKSFTENISYQMSKEFSDFFFVSFHRDPDFWISVERTKKTFFKKSLNPLLKKFLPYVKGIFPNYFFFIPQRSRFLDLCGTKKNNFDKK